MANSKGTLSAKRLKFVEEYQKDLNATKAAERAGYSVKSAGQIGHNLLKDVDIAKALEQSRQIWADRIGITKDAVLNELAALGFANMETFLNVNGADDVTIDLSEASKDDLKSLHSVEITTTVFQSQSGDVTETVKKNIKLHDKRQALQDIGKHLGMFTDKLDIDVKAAVIPITFAVRPAKGNVRVTKD